MMMKQMDGVCMDDIVKDVVDRSVHPIAGKTHQCLLPPSPNWYCSKICDWARSDVFGLLFAFGAMNSVFIYQIKEKQEYNDDADSIASTVKASFFAQLVRGKRDRRVTTVQFLMDTTGKLCLVCGGEEGSVQIWNVASLTMIEQHRKHKVEVMAVTVSATLDASFIVAGDRQGQITTWERDIGKVCIFMPISGDGIYSLAVSPHEKALIAVGYRSGILCLVDATKGTVRHRLAGHDQEVQGVAWKLTVRRSRPGEEDEGSIGFSTQEVWLASSSRDKKIKVWKVSLSGVEEPCLEHILRLPTGKQGTSYTQTKQLWLPIAWSSNSPQQAVDKHRLWSGSFDGALLRWEWNVAKTDARGAMEKTCRTPCKPVVVKGGHRRMLFNIVMVPPRGCGRNEKEFVSMLTISLDREVRLWKENNVSSKSSAASCVHKLSGLGGHAYSVSYNAATGLVAGGIGDQTIRLYQLGTETGSSATTVYQCDLLWKGLQSKITCVQWHPFQHSLLAYGMEDGRVGVYDIHTKTYNHFCTSHDEEVQQLRWIVRKSKNADNVVNEASLFLASMKQLEAAQAEGENLEKALAAQESQAAGKHCDRDDLKVVLWSRDSRGTLLESNADTADQKSRELKLSNTAFEWDEQWELVAIGRGNGVVEVVRWDDNAYENSTAVCHFHEHLASVTCLAWGKGPDAGLLASGGQDGTLFVYSCKHAAPWIAQAATFDVGKVIQECRLLGNLVGHSNKILDLRWWCSDDARSFLASSSADGSVQVWNPSSFQSEACFNHHVGRVLSLNWVRPYTLVTGGEDQTLRFWDFRQQQNETLTKSKTHGKLKHSHKAETLSSSPLAAHAPVHTQSEDAVFFKNEEASLTAGNCNAKVLTSKAPTKKSVMIFHSETMPTPTAIASACCSVAGVKQEACSATPAMDVDEAVHNLLNDTDRVSLQGFFASECSRFRDEREWESLANTLLIQGNIREALRIVAKEGALTPTWLSYAPVAGIDVWRKMTNLYAHQLDVQGDKKAAGSFSAFHYYCCVLSDQSLLPVCRQYGCFAAFHFLSISKIRSAVACLVSADAYKEALALIRSRLGPCDPLLYDTLWKYADFLGMRGCHGEAALALLKAGSVKAKSRAVHTLVSTGNMIYVKCALDVLLTATEKQEKVGCEYEADHHNDVEKLSFPASFFISVASQALVQARLDIAETAGYLLQSWLTGGSSLGPHRLTWCLLSIVRTLDEYQLAHCMIKDFDDEVVAKRVDSMLHSDAPISVCEFFEFLTNPCMGENDSGDDHLFDLMVEKHALSNFQETKQHQQWLTRRVNQFWSAILSVCQRCGYWFDTEGDVRIQEAQDVLIEASCFSNIEKAVVRCVRKAQDNSTILRLQVGQKVLRFVMDVMSTSFVGALEHMQEIFLLLAQDKILTSTHDTRTVPLVFESVSHQVTSAERLDIMLLLYPGGFAFPKKLPQCGELAEEQHDTCMLWTSMFISQCKLFVEELLTPIAEKNRWANVQDMTFSIQALLCQLRCLFLHDKATISCDQYSMDPGNQLQLQELLNEMCVAVNRSVASQEEDVDCCTDEHLEQNEDTSE